MIGWRRSGHVPEGFEGKWRRALTWCSEEQSDDVFLVRSIEWLAETWIRSRGDTGHFQLLLEEQSASPVTLWLERQTTHTLR